MPGPKPEVSALEILRYMTQHPDPAFVAVEIADEFDKTRQWAHNRLQTMENDGLVKSKKVGNSRFYWITEAGGTYLYENRPTR